METPDSWSHRQALRALRTDRPPDRDLWPQIHLALRPGRPRSIVGDLLGGRTLRLAAGLVLAVAATMLLRTQHDAADIGGAAGDPPPVAHAADALLHAYSEVLALERAGADAGQTGPGRPGDAERRAAARELDASLASLAGALHADPHSKLLLRLMHQTLHQRRALTLETLAG